MQSPGHAMQISAGALDLLLHRPFVISRSTKRIASNLLVEITCENIIGIGEAAPSDRYGQSQEQSLNAIGDFDLPRASHPLESALILDAFASQFPRETAALCAIEMALWDWAGKKQGKPLHELFDIDTTQLPKSSFTISIDSPEGIRERVEEAKNWPFLKVKMQGGDLDYECIEELRRHTNTTIRVDANEAWELEEAIEKIQWLTTQNCELVEQPLPAGNLIEMQELKSKSAIALIADEDVASLSQVSSLAAGFDGINIKLMKTGGVANALRFMQTAQDANLQVMLGCFVESSLGISAALQIAALARWVDLDGAALLDGDPFKGCFVDEGDLHLSREPGLGVSLREEPNKKAPAMRRP